MKNSVSPLLLDFDMRILATVAHRILHKTKAPMNWLSEHSARRKICRLYLHASADADHCVVDEQKDDRADYRD